MTAQTLDMAVDLPASSTPAPRRSRSTILGFAPLKLAAVLALFVLVGWLAWVTYALLELRDRRVVTVSLATIVKDFVEAESRAATSPEVASARTKAYLEATDAAIRTIAADGTIVLVSEAVVGNSVPDVTAVVAAAVNARLAKRKPAGSAGEGGNGL